MRFADVAKKETEVFRFFFNPDLFLILRLLFLGLFGGFFNFVA